jgi:hypothetical protein
MTNFQRALLDELRSRVVERPGARPAPVRLARPRLALGGVAVAIAGLAVGVVSAVHEGQTPAYAVTDEPDGSVSVAVNRIESPAEANQHLRDSGDRVIVMVPSDPEDCAMSDRGTPAPDGITNYIVMPKSDENIARVYPHRLPPNTVVVVIPYARDAGGPPTAVAIPYLVPGPKCVVDPSR